MIKHGDYVEGYENYGHDIRRMRGWAVRIHSDGAVEIRCDDEYNGARGSALISELGEIRVVEEEPGWYLSTEGHSTRELSLLEKLDKLTRIYSLNKHCPNTIIIGDNAFNKLNEERKSRMAMGFKVNLKGEYVSIFGMSVVRDSFNPDRLEIGHMLSINM